jgi:hypothetical protein
MFCKLLAKRATGLGVLLAKRAIGLGMLLAKRVSDLGKLFTEQAFGRIACQTGSWPGQVTDQMLFA